MLPIPIPAMEARSWERPISWLAHWVMVATCCCASALFGVMSVEDVHATAWCRFSSAIIAFAEQPMSSASMCFIDPIMASMSAPIPCIWPVKGRACES